jgi:hypothetical protein
MCRRTLLDTFRYSVPLDHENIHYLQSMTSQPPLAQLSLVIWLCHSLGTIKKIQTCQLELEFALVSDRFENGVS